MTVVGGEEVTLEVNLEIVEADKEMVEAVILVVDKEMVEAVILVVDKEMVEVVTVEKEMVVVG